MRRFTGRRRDIRLLLYVHGRAGDLPAAYQANLDSVDAPFDGLPAGGTPHMSAQDVADLQCFIETLTDGYLEGVTPQDPKCIN